MVGLYWAGRGGAVCLPLHELTVSSTFELGILQP